jgi:large repetitive protein
MRKEYVLAMVFCLLFVINSRSQNFDWAKGEGLWAYDYGYGITADNAGNSYAVGKYEEVGAMFSDSSVGCVGNHDIFITKYGPDGKLKWISTAGGVLGDYATCVTTDNQYLYVAGEIEGYGVDVFFENSPIVLKVTGHNDIFVAKYDMNNGQVLWAKRAGAYKNDKALGISTDPSGNIYICGLFNDTAVFDNITVYGNGKNDMFVAKYDGNGTVQWVRTAGSAERDEAKGIKCDANGNIYVTGAFNGTVDFGGHTMSAPNGYWDMFLLKYDGNGNVLWARSASSDYDEVGWGVTMDNAGRVYVAGEFNAY